MKKKIINKFLGLQFSRRDPIFQKLMGPRTPFWKCLAPTLLLLLREFLFWYCFCSSFICIGFSLSVCPSICLPDHWHPIHDDIIKWKYFPCYWPFVQGIHRPPVNSLYKGQWRGAVMFSLICAWADGWVNNRNAGDLRCHHVHCDFTIMQDNNIQHLYNFNQSPLIVNRSLRNEFQGNLNKTQHSAVKKINLKMSSAKWWQFCLCPSVIILGIYCMF